MKRSIEKAAAGPFPEEYPATYLSRAHQQLAEHAAKQPEEVLRTAYGELRALNQSTLSRAQPWPVLLPREKMEAYATVATDLVRLLLDLPHRVFRLDPERLREFYRIDLDQARLIATLVDSTDILASATARGDFLETEKGLQCLEINVGGGLGGWSVGVWTQSYLEAPLVRDFLAEGDVRFSYRIPARIVLRRILEESAPLATDGQVNIAFVVPTEDLLVGTGRWAEDYAAEYRAVLAGCEEHDGEAITCCIDALREEGRTLCFEDRRIHAVVEACDGNLTRPVLSALLAGAVRVYNGPVNRVLADKLNLALLSEMVDSDLLSPAEQRLVRHHVPWTRRVSAEFVDFEGERHYLPDLLEDRRERMVLKPGYSGHGENVLIGSETSGGRWAEAIEQALDEGGWVAQELLEGLTCHFPVDDDPRRLPQPHDVVWGLLTCGTDFAGCFVRLMPRGGHRVINSAQGACVGVVLEVEEGAVPPSQ
jgi:hypothetical protein